MILNVNATNKKSGEVISFALEGNADEGFTYEGTHMQEVTDNKVREVCNGLILLGSPIYTIKAGETETIENSTYTVKIPMQHGVDSLNVAAAGAVAFWELGKR